MARHQRNPLAHGRTFLLAARREDAVRFAVKSDRIVYFSRREFRSTNCRTDSAEAFAAALKTASIYTPTPVPDMPE
jgi:hypothetical protein